MKRGLRHLLCAGVVVAAMSRPARADVLEIADSGAVSVRSGAAAVEWRVDAAPEVAPDVPAAAVTLVDAGDAPAAYRASLADAAGRYGVSPRLLAALVWNESRWRPGAVSPKGAIGLAQLMPGTARQLGVDARDPVASLAGGARYLRAQLDLFGGDIERALAAYNAGPARVRRAGGIPAIAETRAYVATIIDRLGIDRLGIDRLGAVAPAASGALLP